MLLTKNTILNDTNELRYLYSDLRTRFPELSKWYMLGLQWSHDVMNKKGIDESFGKIYELYSAFRLNNEYINHLLNFELNGKTDVNQYTRDLNSSIDTLVELEKTCNTIKMRQQLMYTLLARH